MNSAFLSRAALATLGLVSTLRAEDAPKPAPVPVQPAVPATPPAPAVPAPNKEKFEALQGIWEGVELGHETDGPCVVTIVGDTMHFQRGRGKAWHKAVLETPAGTGPQQIRAMIKESSATNFVGKSASMIYRLAPDGSLTLVGGRPGEPYEPKGFEEDEHTRRFILKKVVPKAPPTPAT